MSSLLRTLFVANSALIAYCQSYYDPNINKNAPANFASIYERKIAFDYGGESDGFGKSVAVHGNTMLIGSCFSDTHGSQGGNAHIYTLDYGDVPSSTNGWTFVTSLNTTETYPYDLFGWDVALVDGVAAVGAWNHDDPLENSGAVYMFATDASTGEWTSTATLRGTYQNEYFGISVAINWDADSLLVGAAGHPDVNGNAGGYGAAYVYKLGHDGVSWNKKALLRAQDSSSKFDYFGISVALDGRIGVIGAYGSNPGTGESAGAAYVINGDEDGKNWLVVQKITASDSSQNSFYGREVAIGNGTIAIGADGESAADVSSGAVYIYRLGRNSGNWKEKQKIVPTVDVIGNELFGTSLALWEDTLVVGAVGSVVDGVKSGSVAVFRFDDDDSKWSPLTTMAASDGSSSDKYGASVAIHGTTIVVGTELADGYDYNSGAVYAYTTIPAYAYFTDESLSTAAVSLLTVGAFILSASVVLWVYKSGRLNSVLERDCYFGSVGHSDFDASRRGDFELACGDSTHSTSSRAPLSSSQFSA